MDQYPHFTEVWNAFARFINQPRNPALAAMELMDKLSQHGREALKDWDEIEDRITAMDAIESETGVQKVREVA